MGAQGTVHGRLAASTAVGVVFSTRRIGTSRRPCSDSLPFGKRGLGLWSMYRAWVVS